jgi:hypothetical protein
LGENRFEAFATIRAMSSIEEKELPFLILALNIGAHGRVNIMISALKSCNITSSYSHFREPSLETHLRYFFTFSLALSLLLEYFARKFTL